MSYDPNQPPPGQYQPPQGGYPYPPAAGYPPSYGYGGYGYGYGPPPKQKVIAGLLGLFLGSFGVHNFYLGRTSIAVTQLVLTVSGYCLFFLIFPILAPIGVAIWSFVEAIMIFMGSPPFDRDADGVPLV